MKTAKLFQIEKFSDHRGELLFCNQVDDFLFKRFYMLFPSEELHVRAWQGHLHEEKIFFALKGEIKIVLIPILDLLNNKFGKPEVYKLKATNPQLLFVPGGYLNGIQFNNLEGQLMVFSNFSLEESKNDDVRFEKSNFYVW